jgi:hypothetical protein
LTNLLFFHSAIMRFEDELGIRRVVLTTSTFSFLIGLPIVYGLQYLPPDHVQLRATLTAYIAFLLVVSIVGIVAAVTVCFQPSRHAVLIRRQRNATLNMILATHLLVDSIVLVIPRILFIRFSLSLPGMICSNSQYPDEASMMGSVDALYQLSSPAWSENSCLVWMWGLEYVLVAGVACHVAVQTFFGLRLFAYASWLGRQKRLEKALC